MNREDLVRQVVALGIPGYEVQSVAFMGEGQENTAYEVNGELVVRFSKDPDAGTRANMVNREAELLAAVAALSFLPVPKPAFSNPDEGVLLAYFKIPGISLMNVPRRQWLGREIYIAAHLGQLLAALHSAPVGRFSHMVEVDHDPMEVWQQETRDIHRRIEGEIPPSYRSAVQTFLGALPPEGVGEQVFSHNDLGFEHVIIDPDSLEIAGIIDWSDSALGDPAYDFGLILRDLGPACLEEALKHYPAGINGAALRDRAVYYARCSAIEDLAYGIESANSRYADKSLEALEWLFPS